MQRLLENDTSHIPDDTLMRENERLKAEIELLKDSLAGALHQSAAANRALKAIQTYTGPFYQVLRAIHGEVDAVGLDDTFVSESAKAGNLQPHSREKWQAWKNQLPPSCGKVIDALLVQPLTTTQLKGICKVSYESARQAIVILTRNGLIEKDGDMNRLKRL